MDLITLIVVFALIGFCLWLVITYVPMPDVMRKAIVVIVVLLLVLFVARLLLGDGSLRLVR